MNPVFVFIIIMLAILLWFFLSFSFEPIGRLFYRLWKDAIDEMKDEKDSK